jgi:hypothetical protein
MESGRIQNKTEKTDDLTMGMIMLKREICVILNYTAFCVVIL